MRGEAPGHHNHRVNPLHRITRPRAADAPAIHELTAACDTAVLGRPDLTPDDVAGELAEPGFDLGTDAWLAHDPGGHPAAVADVGVYRADLAKQALVQEYGFTPATSFHRMRVDFDGPVPPPEPPPGVTLHDGRDEQVRREAHRVHQEGFAGHFGHTYAGYDAWYARRQARSTTDWAQLVLARADGRPAAMVLGDDQFASDEGCGYVATLAVLPEFRGRGLGRLLLRTALAADAARGRKGTILHVDSNNTTPALGLYESEGMRPVLVMDVWRRSVRLDAI